MNKLYFAKYLPAKGEIKDGQLGISVNGALYTHHEHLGKEYGKPVKLFLCSRDIQVGDKVLCPMPYQNDRLEEFIIVERPAGYNLDMLVGIFSDGRQMTEPAYLNQSTFKVIGEISPEATWVKEGDEFDEEEIGILYNFVGEDSDDELFTIDSFWKEAKRWYHGKVPKYINPPIAIKGPCGHFH